MGLVATLQTLVEGRSLDRPQAEQLMRACVGGELPDALVAALLVALQAKGPTADELAGMASVMRENALSLAADVPDLVDTCGTGGGKPTFNLSTGAAIVAAAAGAKVAKHGNRSVTSKCGSADVLEALGVKLSGDPERLGHLLHEIGIVFLFAPNHHPAVAKVGHVRRMLGIRTVFNLLGPLANPAGARKQLVGVYARAYVLPMAEALLALGAERAFVVFGEDGMDEASPCAPTHYAEVREGRVDCGTFTPPDFGITDLDERALSPGDDVRQAASALHEALRGGSPRGEALVPNAALALVLAGLAGNVKEGAAQARQTIASGDALRKLDAMVGASGE